MTTLRLCFIARADSVHTRRWVDPFVERGHQIWVINAAAGPAQRPWEGVHLTDLPGIINVPWLRYPVWTLYAGAVIRRIQPDLVHAHSLPLSGWVAGAVNYHPLVVTVWGSDILLHPDRSWMARKLARWVLNRADVVTAPAQPLFERAAFFAGGTEKVRLIHWGVDCDTFAPDGGSEQLALTLDVPGDAFVLLCPRGLRPVYDIETVLRALKHIVEVEPRALLILIDFNARPNYRKKVDQWIQAWNLEEHVRFLPRINSRERMAALYRLADVVLSLATSDSLSLTVLEAMACGTPVVVSDLPAYDGWVIDGKTGYAVPPRDGEAAANVALSLLKSESKRVQIGQRCRRMVCERASLDRQVEGAMSLYENLLLRP